MDDNIWGTVRKASAYGLTPGPPGAALAPKPGVLTQRGWVFWCSTKHNRIFQQISIFQAAKPLAMHVRRPQGPRWAASLGCVPHSWQGP